MCVCERQCVCVCVFVCMWPSSAFTNASQHVLQHILQPVLQHIRMLVNTFRHKHPATHCNVLQHTATHECLSKHQYAQTHMQSVFGATIFYCSTHCNARCNAHCNTREFEWVAPKNNSHAHVKWMPSHIRVRHVTRMWMSHGTRIWLSHITHMSDLCPTHASSMSHTWMIHITHMNRSYHTHESFMSRSWIQADVGAGTSPSAH